MTTFKNEYEYLVHLVACALQDKQPAEKGENLSFDKVFQYGKEHEVANIAFVSVEKLKYKPNDELYIKWKTIYGLSVQRHINQMQARQTIVDALNTAEIRHVETQGTVMKTLYPYPEWRMMSDIDFIIDKENLLYAESVMQGLGYKTKNINDIEIDAYGENGIVVELHSMFFNPKSECYGSITDAFSTSSRIGNTYSYRLSDTMFYLYNLLHCVKHFVQYGAGIRRIMDMYIMRAKMIESVDKQFVNDVIDNSGYRAAVSEISSVADKWFLDVEVNHDISDIEELIFQSNNHGTQQVLIKNDYMKSNKKGEKFFKLRRVWSLIFPPKETIYKSYPTLKNKKTPIVFCWVYRWFVILTDSEKRKSANNHVSLIRKTKIK